MWSLTNKVKTVVPLACNINDKACRASQRKLEKLVSLKSVCGDVLRKSRFPSISSAAHAVSGPTGCPWTSHQSITGLTYGDRQPLKLTHTQAHLRAI